MVFQNKNKYDLIKKRILFKIKNLIYFKKIINIKDNNNLLLNSNGIVDEPYEYSTENKCSQLNNQTSSTISYLFLNSNIENI